MENMNKRIKFFLGLLLVVLVGAFSYFIIDYFALYPVDLDERQIIVPQAYEEVEEAVAEEVEYKLEVFAENLFVPWSIVFTAPDRVLVTERNGKLRVIGNGLLLDEPIKVFNEVSAGGEEGLMGLTLHPDYESNHLIYLSMAYSKGDGIVVKVVRFKDEGDFLSGETVIIDNIPAARFHAGCRIRFGPDGKLYITTGDATTKELAQDASSLVGKVLRLNPDGSIPEDNPFKDSLVYTIGHRNSQGIDWHPVSGIMYSSEHGPSVFDGPAGGDEVNIILKGENYGWPLVSHERNEEGLVAPLLVFTPAVAPASGSFYNSDIFPQFQNNFFFGLLRGEGIMRAVFSEEDPSEVIFFERLDGIDVGRVRDVVQGPDGYIYFSTSNMDGRGTVRPGDDKIYRLVPVL